MGLFQMKQPLFCYHLPKCEIQKVNGLFVRLLWFECDYNATRSLTLKKQHLMSINWLQNRAVEKSDDRLIGQSNNLFIFAPCKK